MKVSNLFSIRFLETSYYLKLISLKKVIKIFSVILDWLSGTLSSALFLRPPIFLSDPYSLLHQASTAVSFNLQRLETKAHSFRVYPN